MTDEKVIDKIRKLLALSQNTPYPSEAETALAAAQRMLLEHELVMGDVVEPEPIDDPFTQVVATETPFRVPPESAYVWWIVEQYFFVQPIVTRGDNGRRQVLIVGRREHVPMAVHVGIYLSRTFRALWDAYRTERHKSAADRKHYYQGLQCGISDRLGRDRRDMMRANANLAGLITRRDRDLEIAVFKRFGRLQTEIIGANERVDRATFEAGYQRGQKISINKPLGAHGSPAAISQQR